MAATPPSQIIESPHTPPTPLHGAAYDHEASPRRTSTRLRQKRAFEEEAETQTKNQTTRAARTPSSPRALDLGHHSPDRTPQRRTTSRRVQILSPTSPESDTTAPKNSTMRPSNHQQYLSAGTTLNDGMLPTPVKTPNKKQKLMNKPNLTARMLFQDQLPDEIMVSSRPTRKTKRYNGFSLESFRAENGSVEVFTDSRDQIPQPVDEDTDNPFVDHEKQTATSKKVTGTTKRRKVSQPKKMDPQVEEAIDNDEGMVYVFRGKKIYRRFDDGGEEEEDIDSDDLGLLRHTTDRQRAAKPMKTLTRKSIRPTRLFQSEEQKRARELEKEEEAVTDIDEFQQSSSTATNQIPAETSSRSSRSKGKQPADTPNNTKAKSEKGSLFDGWLRIKPGSASHSASSATRGRKRAASPSFDEPLTLST